MFLICYLKSCKYYASEIDYFIEILSNFANTISAVVQDHNQIIHDTKKLSIIQCCLMYQ